MTDFQTQVIGALVLASLALQLLQIRYLRRAIRRIKGRYQ